jgi:hypothetical protein
MPPRRRTSYSYGILWVIAALILMVLAFYVGTHFSTAQTPAPVVATTTPSVVVEGAAYYANPSEWQTYTNNTGGYSIEYPTDFDTVEPTSVAPTTDWMANNIAQAPGIKSFTLTIPAAFEPQTNFVDATLTIGYSQNTKAIANCLIAQNGEATSTSQTNTNATFATFTLSNAGAGQLYDTTSYRTTHAGACYAVEYTIHSTELGNFPASYNMQAFDEQQVQTVLNTIVGTFTFL